MNNRQFQVIRNIRVDPSVYYIVPIMPFSWIAKFRSSVKRVRLSYTLRRSISYTLLIERRTVPSRCILQKICRNKANILNMSVYFYKCGKNLFSKAYRLFDKIMRNAKTEWCKVRIDWADFQFTFFLFSSIVRTLLIL